MARYTRRKRIGDVEMELGFDTLAELQSYIAKEEVDLPQETRPNHLTSAKEAAEKSGAAEGARKGFEDTGYPKAMKTKS